MKTPPLSLVIGHSSFVIFLFAASAGAWDLGKVPSLQVSPDGTWVIYERETAIKKGKFGADIYTAALDGSGEKRLTFFENCRRPSISPDGAHIVFWFDNGLYAMERDGTHTHLVAETAGDLFLKSPVSVTWTAPDQFLAYGIRWPEWDAKAPGFKGHIGLFGLDGFRQWVAGISSKDGISAAAGVPGTGRIILALDGKLLSFSEDMRQSFLLAPVGKSPEIVPSADGSRIAYTHDGTVSLLSAVGGPPEEVGQGTSLSWRKDGRFLYFLQESKKKAPVLMTYRVAEGESLPLETLLTRRGELRENLEKEEARLRNIEGNLLTCWQGLGEAGTAQQNRKKTLDGLDRKTESLKISQEETLYPLLKTEREFEERYEGLRSRGEGLVRRVQELRSAVPRFLQDFDGGVSVAAPFEGFRAETGLLEADSQAFEQELPDLRILEDRQMEGIAQLSALVARKKAELAEQQAAAQEALRERQQKAYFVRMAELKDWGVWIGAGAAVLLLLGMLYLWLVVPRLRIRRRHRQAKADMDVHINHLERQLQGHKNLLIRHKKADAAWEHVVHDFRSVLNDMLHEDTHQNLNRMERLANFYSEITRKIVAMDIEEADKERLLGKFKKLFSEGVTDTMDDSPFERKLERLYQSVTQEDVRAREH